MPYNLLQCLHDCNRFQAACKVYHSSINASSNSRFVQCLYDYFAQRLLGPIPPHSTYPFAFTTKETMVVRELRWWYAIRGERNRSSIFKL